MKTSRVLLLLVVLFVSNIANAQNVKNLYEFVINDYYDELYKEGYISKQDTVRFKCGNCDCVYECFDYDIELKNDKIKIGFPNVNATLYYLSPPELKKQYLIINVGICSVVYQSNNDVEIIFYGSTEYVFKYSRTKHKYIFKSKKQFGI